MENELPEGWIEVKIEEIAEVKGGKRLPLGESFSKEVTNYPYIRVADFTNQGTINQEGLKYISESNFKQIKNYTISKHDVYISIAGTIGKTGIIPDNLDGANLTENAAKIIIKSLDIIDQKFVYYFTISSFFRSQLGEATKQVAMPKLALKRVLDLYFLLPPLAEQRRIVAKLDAAFSHLETLKTSLARIPELLRKFRQTVLTQAVTGRLTEEWREENPDSKNKLDNKFLGLFQKAGDNNSDENIIIPENWNWNHVGKIAKLINGDRGKNYPNVNEYVPVGIPFINTGHITPDGSLSKSKMNFISREKFDTLNGGKIEPGDLVYCLRGATMGKTAIVDMYNEGAIASSLVIIRPKKGVVNKFLYYYLISPFGKKLIKRFDNGSAQPNLSANSVKIYPFPLTSLEEQQEIVNRVEALFAQADALEAQYQSLKVKIDKLPQALLAKAFRGKLVPQEPTDEPASVLLEKIKAATSAVSKKSWKTGQTALAFMGD